MQFGIMEMQMGMLVPPAGAPLNVVMSHLGGLQHLSIVEPLHKHGFKLIELGGDLTLFFPHMYGPASVDKLAAYKEAHGLRFTCHLPLWSVEASTPLTPVREGSVKAVVEIIRATQVLAPEAYVLHATGGLAAEFYHGNFPDHVKALLMRQFQAGAATSIQTVLSETGIHPRKLAIETIGFPFDLTLELAEQFDLSMCLDTGHILAGFSGQIGLMDALEQMLPRLADIHLHDSALHKPGEPVRHGVDHKALGTGDIDTGAFLDRLDEAGYDKPIIFELTAEEALQSLDVIREIRPQYL